MIGTCEPIRGYNVETYNWLVRPTSQKKISACEFKPAISGSCHNRLLVGITMGFNYPTKHILFKVYYMCYNGHDKDQPYNS